jgi:uncharacterized protein YdeI (YjbR/CyaY-like superfamily)
MSAFHPEISEYIARSADFAQPILIELRAIVHSFCPEVKETMKWSFPNFEYKGSILCSMASFKQHCAFSFWLGSHLKDEYGILQERKTEGMGHLGKIRSLDDVPSPDKLGPLILQAMSLIDQGVKLQKTPPKTQKELLIPEILIKALEENPAAKTVFDNFSFSHKREYVDWLNDAKTAATLNKRLDTTISNLREGKSKEWKYRK